MSDIIGRRCIYKPKAYYGTVIGRSDKLPGYLKIEYDNMLGFVALTDIKDLAIDDGGPDFDYHAKRISIDVEYRNERAKLSPSHTD